MRVLFVHPFFLRDSLLERTLMTPYPPLGLLSLAAFVRAVGHEVRMIDATFSRHGTVARLLTSELLARVPPVVCIGSLITLRPAALRLGALSRRQGATVVAGGPDATREPEAYLAPKGPAHFVVAGEGEETLTELLDAVSAGADATAIRGLALPGASALPGGTRHTLTASRAPVAELDVLPVPARDLVNVEGYLDAWRRAHGYSSLTLAVSRGCPDGCADCRAAGFGLRLRLRRPEAVAREMRELQERYAPDRFRLVDDLDGVGRPWLAALDGAMTAAGVSTPFEGLKHYDLTGIAHYDPALDVCAERNRWLPTTSRHAPPVLEDAEVRRRWECMALPAGERIEDP